MGRKAINNEEKTVRITISVDKEVAELLEKYSKIEMLPVSRYISRILKRYFEMK